MLFAVYSARVCSRKLAVNVDRSSMACSRASERLGHPLAVLRPRHFLAVAAAESRRTARR